MLLGAIVNGIDSLIFEALLTATCQQLFLYPLISQDLLWKRQNENRVDNLGTPALGCG